MKIAIITLMRKGSKRFPDKCRAIYKKKPLYMHTVEKALKLGHPYYFLTDYTLEELPDLPESVTILPRSEYFAGDTHRTCEEIKVNGINADFYILLQVTNPLRSVPKMKSWVRHFVSSRADVGFSTYKIPDGYYYNSLGKPVNFDQGVRTDNGCRRGGMVVETGNFYIFRKCQLERKHILDGGNQMHFADPYLMDVDFEEDLKR